MDVIHVTVAETWPGGGSWRGRRETSSRDGQAARLLRGGRRRRRCENGGGSSGDVSPCHARRRRVEPFASLGRTGPAAR